LSEEFKNFEERPKYFTKDDLVKGPKKFVFQINPENIKYIESMSYQEKQDLINELIILHKLSVKEQQKTNSNLVLIKKLKIIFVALLVGIPILFYTVSMSLHYTQASYTDMQKNFERYTNYIKLY